MQKLTEALLCLSYATPLPLPHPTPSFPVSSSLHFYVLTIPPTLSPPSNHPQVLLFDLLGRTYDGPITFTSLGMLREYVQVRQVLALCCLQWPTQDVYQLFDRCCVMNEGRVMYQGRAH